MTFSQLLNSTTDKKWTAEEAAFSKRIMRAWSDFAKFSNPGFVDFGASKSQHIFSLPFDKDEAVYGKGQLAKRYSFWLTGYTGVNMTAF